MISRIIEWCARNRFLVFTGVLILVSRRHLVAADMSRSMLCRTFPMCRSSVHTSVDGTSLPMSLKIR